MDMCTQRRWNSERRQAHSSLEELGQRIITLMINWYPPPCWICWSHQAHAITSVEVDSVLAMVLKSQAGPCDIGCVYRHHGRCDSISIIIAHQRQLNVLRHALMQEPRS